MVYLLLLKICLADLGSKEPAWAHLCELASHTQVEKGNGFRNSRPKHLELRDTNLEGIAFF